MGWQQHGTLGCSSPHSGVPTFGRDAGDASQLVVAGKSGAGFPTDSCWLTRQPGPGAAVQPTLSGEPRGRRASSAGMGQAYHVLPPTASSSPCSSHRHFKNTLGHQRAIKKKNPFSVVIFNYYLIKEKV